MAKRLFLILFSGLIGVLLNPGFLAADDSILIESPEFYAVKTVLPAPKPKPTPKQPVPMASQSVPSRTVAQSAPKLANYTISYYIGSPQEFNNTAFNLSYSGLYKYRKMVYGHNSATLLGSLSSRRIGETITVTEGGVAQNYQIRAINTYQKTADGYLNGDQNLMTQIANTALGHDIALFTCAGRSYGNGDASHRLVVFANRI